MKQVEAIFVSDFHLNGYTTLFPEQDDSDDFVFNVLEQVMKYAKDYGVKNIIVPGDVFDSPEPTDEAKIKLMRFFKQHHLFMFYIIPGNHDFSHEGLMSMNMLQFLADELYLFQNVKYFDKPTFASVDGVPFTFLPWPHVHVENTAPHFVVAHIDVNGAKRVNGKTVTGKKVQPDERHMWFIGHIHMTQKVGKNIFYTGNILQKNFGEPPSKGFVHATFTQKGSRWACVPRFIPVHTPYELHTLVANNHDELMALEFKTDRRKIFRYRLQYHKDIVLPPSWLARHPEIIKPEPFSSTTQLNYDQAANAATLTTEFDLKGDLDNWLKERDVSDDHRKGALHILQDIMTENQISVE